MVKGKIYIEQKWRTSNVIGTQKGGGLLRRKPSGQAMEEKSHRRGMRGGGRKLYEGKRGGGGLLRDWGWEGREGVKEKVLGNGGEREEEDPPLSTVQIKLKLGNDHQLSSRSKIQQGARPNQAVQK